jgi:hypothetical protein
MNGNNFTRLSGSKRSLFALLASTVVLMAGCANMATTAAPATPLSSADSIGGKLHGGSQPITGATVTLYYAGNSGYGSGLTQGGPATIAAVTTTDSTGAFSFVHDPTPNDPTPTDPTKDNTFSCPLNLPNATPAYQVPTGVESNPLVYVIARGGNTLNTGDSSNDAAVFLGVFGLCTQIGSSNMLDLNEVTTVASMAALQQYFNPVTETIGTDSIGNAKTALVNTLTTISNLANTATGTAVASTQLNGGGGDVSGVTVTATAPATTINLIANILAACVNNSLGTASPCQTLFDNATPPNVVQTDRPYQSAAFLKATDTLQAAYYMLSNPTNAGALNPEKLFGLAAAVGAPFQPSLTSAPPDWSITIAYSSTSTCGGGSSPGSFINAPQDINIDSSGNLWIANGQATTGNLSSITVNGTPNDCVFLGGGASRGSTIDHQGNIWYATTAANNLYRYNPVSHGVLTYTTAKPPLAVTADGAGNVYFSTAPDGSLYQIADGADALAVSTPTQVATGLGALPIRLMPDLTGAVWATSGASFVSQIAPPNASYNGTIYNTTTGFLTTPFGTIGDSSYGIAITRNGSVVVSSVGSTSKATGSLSYLTGSGLNFNLNSNWPTAAGLGGLNNPTAIVVDPQYNVWAPNNTGVASVSDISISPSNLGPFTSVANGFQQGTSFASGSRATVIDMSGNVWVAGDGTVANPSNLVTEIVGAGAPVYQPYARGLFNGRFQNLP